MGVRGGEHMKQKGCKGRRRESKGSDRNQSGRESCCEIPIACSYWREIFLSPTPGLIHTRGAAVYILKPSCSHLHQLFGTV